jgi:hypothetical protein
MNIVLGFLRGLKLPVKLLTGWLRKRRKRTELEEKCHRYVKLNTLAKVNYRKGFFREALNIKNNQKPTSEMIKLPIVTTLTFQTPDFFFLFELTFLNKSWKKLLKSQKLHAN